MKKFLSLMLAVLLLVSALPFQAFANDQVNIVIDLVIDGNTKDSQPITVPMGIPFNEADVRTWASQYLYGEYFNDSENYTYLGVTNVTDSTAAGWQTAVRFESVVDDDEPAEPVDPCADGHDFGEWAVTKEATCGAAGVETRVCVNNAEHKETRSIPATGDHEYVNGECECGAKESFALKFNYKNANGTWTSSVVTITVGARINAPEVPSVSGLKHTGWDNNLQDGWTRWYIGMPTEYTATYVESTDDDLVDLTVYAYYYVDGEYHHKAKLFVEEFKESKTNNMVPWIYDEGIDAVKAALAAQNGADGYQWDPTVFYNCYDDGEISRWGDLYATGNRDLYVKVNSKKAIEATVLLYVHTAKERTYDRVITMPGYTKGDFVSYNEALAAVKTKYTGSKMEMSDLYDEGDWEDLMDGYKPSGSKTVKVETYGTTEIHVILSNATNKTTTSNADSSNPKTGDYITIAVGTMAMAAAALVTLAELKKRKMI